MSGHNDVSADASAGTETAADASELAMLRALAEARHELRQPLAALSIYAGMLKSHVAPAGLPMLARIDDCVANLNHLISTLLLPCQQGSNKNRTDEVTDTP